MEVDRLMYTKYPNRLEYHKSNKKWNTDTTGTSQVGFFLLFFLKWNPGLELDCKENLILLSTFHSSLRHALADNQVLRVPSFCCLQKWKEKAYDNVVDYII